MKKYLLKCGPSLFSGNFFIIFILTDVFFFVAQTVHAQVIYQPPQIAWGRYFDHSKPGFHWDQDDLGERIYWWKNSLYFMGRTKSDSINYSESNNEGHAGDAFIASYDPVCHKYNWRNYLGSLGPEEYAYCAAFDKVGDEEWIYIAGEMNAGSQPKSSMLAPPENITTGCSTIYQKKPGDKFDAFIAKYDARTGKLIRWTYFGGKGMDQILSLVVDTITHNVYFAGYTESPAWLDYPALGFTPYKGDYTGPGKGMMGCLDSCLNTLKYFTYYGGNGQDRFHALEILYTNTKRFLVGSGTAQSVSGIVPPNCTNCFDTTYAEDNDQKNPDVFIFIWNVNTLSSAPDWSSYFGGENIDRGRGISISENHDIFLTGQTLSVPDTGEYARFVPTTDAYMTAKSTRYETFLAKFHITTFKPKVNVELELLTYYGGGKDDYAKGCIAFSTNNHSNGSDTVVLTGLTYSNDMQSINQGAYMLSNEINGNNKEKKRDAFVAVLTKDPSNPSAQQKLSSFSYLGGEYDETDLIQDTGIVQKSYNPGICQGPNGSVFIVYTTKGIETKDNGNIPVEYSAYHCMGGNCDSVRQPDVYIAQVFPFGQHFEPVECDNKIYEQEQASKNQFQIRLLPMPFSELTTLEIFSSKEENTMLTINDLRGKTILTMQLPIHTGLNHFPIDLTNYAAGMYNAAIEIGGERNTLKLIKQ